MKKEDKYYLYGYWEFNSLKKFYYKLFFNIPNTRIKFELETGFSTQSNHSIGLEIDYSDDVNVKLSFCCFLFFYIGFNLPESWIKKFEKSLLKYEYDREIRLAIHHNTLWWNFWTSESCSYFHTPLYRKGNFNPVRFLLGEWETNKETLEEQDYCVYLDTGTVDIKIKKDLFTRYRNRWYSSWFKFKFFRWNYSYENVEGSVYDKNIKQLNEAYLYLVKYIYKEKINDNSSKYKKQELV